MELYGFTNVYFEKTSHLKPSYSERWAPITVDEFYNYIALLFYMSYKCILVSIIPLLWLMGQTFHVTKLI